MSVKRQATTELNHENWDQDDPADHEEMGSFKIAPKEMLEKRVIRTAKRRTQVAGDEPKKSVFSGFSGFNKAQPASFDFLSKLTNGNNDSNSSSNKADSSVTSSLFSSKPHASPSGGIFGNQSTTTPTKSPFGSPSTQTGTSSLFGVSAQNTTTPSMFMTSKADSTVKDSPFKIQTVTSSTDNNTDSTKSSMAPVTSSKFDIPSTSANVAKSLFSTTSNSAPFKIQPILNTTAVKNTFGMASKPEFILNEADKKPEDTKNDKKMKYYSKLKGLNESVSDWIKKHVEQTPLCILTPIFKDYEKYLKEIQVEYGSDKEVDKKIDNNKFSTGATQFGNPAGKPVATVNNTAGSSLFNVSPSSKSLFTTQSSATPEKQEKSGTFSFGIGSSTNTSSTITTSSAGFSFGAITSSTASAVTSSPFSFATTTSTTAANGTAAPFSFGIGKPFSFNSNVKQNTDTTEETNEEEDSPPKVEFTPVVEDNTVYDKRCKVFVKKDGNFVDKGVGTLYIKKIEESGKHQLLVRANTNLGTILVNLILVSAIPTQRMGKNNVMLVCIPTPESKPPPTPILIRVKTPEEADQLLETLNKYKA